MSKTDLDSKQRALRLGACLVIGLVIWLVTRGMVPADPGPGDLTASGSACLAVFVATIAGFLIRPLPMGPLVLVALVVLSATGTVGWKPALHGFGDSTVWLVVAAFMLALAVSETGLGRRVALTLVQRFGKTTLGLGYAIVGSELLLGPVVPSNTARGGGVLAPIVDSLSKALKSGAAEDPRRAGEYLVLVGAHANLITAAMFLTGMAANPLVVKEAASAFGIDFGWGTWALGAIVPGLVGLALLPLWIRRLARPELTDTRAAQEQASQELLELGPWTVGEKVTGVVFALLLGLWSTKFLHGMGTGLVAWIGVLTLIVTGTVSWPAICGHAKAWDTLVWLGGLISLATALREQGVVAWAGGMMQGWVGGYGGLTVALFLGLVYFYSMYGFSMLTGHIAAFAATFFAVAQAADVPPMLMIALLAYFSNLCGCTTHYSTGPVVIYFGMGYVPIGRWFKVGFLVSLFHLTIWLGLGLPYWKLLGWW